MASQTQLSLVTCEVHSMRQPCVEMSITRTWALPRLPSRMVADRLSAARLARLRSGWPWGRIESAMVELPRATGCAQEGEEMVAAPAKSRASDTAVGTQTRAARLCS